MSRKRLAVPVLVAAALTAALAPSAQAATEKITRAEYDKVKLGASVATLHSTAGKGACKKTSSTSAAGHTAKTYTCKGNKPYSAATFLFTDGKLDAKSQYGLDGTKSNGKMTKAKYNKIKKGQTVAQMHAKAGKGVCVRGADSQGFGTKTAVYTCTQSRTYGVASFTFTNNKLTERFQSGLK